MPEIHLRQCTALSTPGFIYTACGPFIKERNNRIQRKKTKKRKHTKIQRNRRFQIYLPKQTI